MSDLVLYSFRRCPFAIRVRMVLEEKNIPYRLKEEKLSDLSAELLKLHPEGKVPLLIHDGNVIYESSIITQHLEDFYTHEPRLMPSSPQLRTQMRLWTYWCDHLFKPDLDRFKYEWNALQESAKENLKARLQKYLDQLDQSLEKGQFLLGDQLTLADLHVFPFYRQLSRVRERFEKTFNVRQANTWLESIVKRPSFERVMEKL